MEEQNPIQIKQENSIIIKKTDKPNSYEIGKTGNRFKIHYEEPSDLAAHINELKKLGLFKYE